MDIQLNYLKIIFNLIQKYRIKTADQIVWKEEMKQKVSIIILNWNGWKDTVECIESLYLIDYPSYDVIIVDNGSEDESIEMIKNYAAGELEIKSDFFEFNFCNKPIQIFELTNKNFEPFLGYVDKYDSLASNRKLILIKSDYNSGFSEGNNIGINFSLEILNSEYVFLLNNDTVVDKNFLDELIKFADNNQTIGIVGPRVCYYNKPDKTAYMGDSVNLCNGRISHHQHKLDENSSSVVKIDFVYGCGLLIKKEVIEEIGLLDPNYFLYYEDVDWCLRAHKMGYDVFYLPKSKIWHKISSEESRSLISIYYGNRNSFLLIKKNRNSIGILFCYILLIMNKFILSIYLIIKGKRKTSFTVIQAIYDGMRGNYGYKKLE
jgi:GT2 family glycosyltransferase